MKFPERTKVNMLKIKNIASQNPNKTIAMDFSDGTTVTADLNRTDLTTIQFPDVYTREIKVRILSVYPTLTSYNETPGVTSNFYTQLQGILSGIVPQTFATTLTTGTFNSSQIASVFISEKKMLLNSSKSLKNLAKNYVQTLNEAGTLGIPSTTVRSTLDPLVTAIVGTYTGTSNSNWTGVSANGFSIDTMIKERIFLDYVSNVTKIMER